MVENGGGGGQRAVSGRERESIVLAGWTVGRLVESRWWRTVEVVGRERYPAERERHAAQKSNFYLHVGGAN